MLNADLLKIGSASYASGGAVFGNDMLNTEFTDSTFFAATPSLPISNMPPISESTTIIGYREVYYRTDEHIMVKLTEMYPVAGRVWTNFYNTNTWGGWHRLLDDSVLSGLGWAYQYLSKEAPFYVISESADTTVYCLSRGFQRNTADKAIIFKTTNSSFSASGYAIMCATEFSTTALGSETQYAGLSYSQKITPKGNTVYVGLMNARYMGDYPIVVTIDGVETTIETGISSNGLSVSEPMNQFIYNLADTILF